MPTVLLILGWRLFFYSNEGDEPMHVHAKKGDAQAKYWLDEDRFEIRQAWAHGLTPRLEREVRRIIFGHFDLLTAAWHQHLGESIDTDAD